MIALACRYMRLLPAEALTAATLNAACAIGLGDRVGSLEPGKLADLVVLDYASFIHVARQAFSCNPRTGTRSRAR